MNITKNDLYKYIDDERMMYLLYYRKQPLCIHEERPSKDIIKIELKKRYQTQEAIDKDIRLIDDITRNKLQKHEYFSWLNSDESIIYAWFYLFVKNEKTNRLAISIDDMRLEIIYYFDCKPRFKVQPWLNIDDIKVSWISIKQAFKNHFSWLDKNNSRLCLWALEWTNRYLSEYKEIKVFYSKDNSHTAYEAYCYTQFQFYLWRADNNMKKAFLTNIKKYASQYKNRIKNSGKPVLNTHIDNDTKTKLDYISEHKKMNIKDVVKYLINKEFEEMNN